MKQTREAGFDLTGFGTAKNFERVLKANKLKPAKAVIHKGTGWKYKVYVWKGKGVEIRTGNNPITGAYSEPRNRPREQGYASYIGIKGEPMKVARLVRTIRQSTKDIKDYSPRKSDYIW